MSTLQTINIKNAVSPVNNIVLGSDGSTNIQGTLAMATPFSTRNKLINGSAEIYQRGTGTVTLSSSAQYFVDRWAASNATDGTMTARQTTNAPNGFQNAMYFLTGTADASLAATQYAVANQTIEGYNIVDLAWGTAAAKSVTLSFWVRSSLTGTFGGAIRNGAANRSYPFTFTISAADTYEFKTITIPGDTTGTWATDNTAGIVLIFGLGVGSTYSAAAGSWVAGNYLSANGATSVIGTAGANFYLTGLQFEVGSTATPFERRLLAQELFYCMRYFQPVGAGWSGMEESTTSFSLTSTYQVPMRTTPTGSLISTSISTRIANGGTDRTITGCSIGVLTPSTYGLWCVINCSGGNVAGRFIQNRDGGNIFNLSAEL